MFPISWLALSVAGQLAIIAEPTLRSPDLPSADDVLRRLVERSQTPEGAEKRVTYVCTKQTVTEDFDNAGHLTNRKVKIGQSRSAPRGNNSANKWGSENGVSLDGNLLGRYQSTVVGRETLNGRPAIVLNFVPRQPAPPIHRLQDRLLNRAMGTVWIDEQDYDLAKADLCLSEPVSFGILGAVDALTFSFERARAEDGSWLTRWTEAVFKVRKFLTRIQSRKRVDWTGFKETGLGG